MSSRKRSGGGGSGPKAQQTMAAAFGGAATYTKIKDCDLAKYVNKELSIPGSFWDGCEEDNLDTLYMVKVMESELKHKFQGTCSGAAVRFEV